MARSYKDRVRKPEKVKSFRQKKAEIKDRETKEEQREEKCK